MSDFASAWQTTLLVGLLVVAAVHTKSRLAGALAGAAWVLGAIGFGALVFHDGHPPLVFAGLATPPWLYFAFMMGLLTWNVSVLARAARRTRAATNAATSTTSTTPTTPTTAAPSATTTSTDPPRR